jgi:hypothetical protein
MGKARVTVRTWALLVGVLLAPAGLCGCNPIAMGIATPIPIPPWVTERMEEKYCYKNDTRTPIMPPIPPGTRPFCEDPPALAEVLRVMPPVPRGVPYFYEQFRDNITYTYERIKDTIDPPRFYPLVGPAQLHHCHWKCYVHYLETIDSGYPFPFQCKTQRVQVIYIDKDHLHLYTCTPEMQESVTRDLTGY